MKNTTTVIRRLLLAVGMAGPLLAGVFVAPTAAQDDCYPDGCTEPTNPPPSAEVSCQISTSKGVAGTRISATVTNVEVGTTVRILFDGSEVASNAGDEQSLSASGPLFVRSAAPSQTDDVTLSFGVPDVPPGNYSVVAVGNDFTASCGAGDGTVGFEVLASESTTGGGDGPIAFTGAEVLRMAIVALALLALGYLAVRESRRRAAR